MDTRATFIDRLQVDVDLEMVQLQAVATGEANIRSVNEEYKSRRKKIRAGLRRLGLTDPNPWSDLWLWYGYWKDEPELSTYQARRELVIRRYQPLIDTLDSLQDRQLGTGLDIPRTGWERLDDQSEQLREKYVLAQTTDDYKDIGLRCRDILISLSEETYDPSRHPGDGEPPLKGADAKGRLSQVVKAECQGDGNDRIRRLIRDLAESTWDSAASLLHDRGASDTKARIVANATLFLASSFRLLIPEPTGYGRETSIDEEEADETMDVSVWDDYEPDEEDLRYLEGLAAREGWD